VSTSQAITNGVSVEVEAVYSPERSAPARSQWFFLYTIRITNEADQGVQLLTRQWIITDATGKQQEVRGEGVVGEQPTLAPGDTFEYTSGCPLETPFGSMEGSYGFIAEDRSTFAARVARFELSQPHSLH
jgi:ApaG protein